MSSRKENGGESLFRVLEHRSKVRFTWRDKLAEDLEATNSFREIEEDRFYQQIFDFSRKPFESSRFDRRKHNAGSREQTQSLHFRPSSARAAFRSRYNCSPRFAGRSVTKSPHHSVQLFFILSLSRGNRRSRDTVAAISRHAWRPPFCRAAGASAALGIIRARSRSFVER